MTLTLERPPPRRRADPVDRLRTTMAAVRVSFVWLGCRKSLSAEQKAEAADAFEASGRFLTAGKKLLDTKHPAFRAVTNVRGRILNLWRGMTLPFPEPGIRLIRQDQIDVFQVEMTERRRELATTVALLDENFEELKNAARERLGRLFNSNDYPASLHGLFAVEWDFPSVEPPSYLAELNPALYEEECRRVAARFDEALALAEEAFSMELAGLVTHLTDRLSGTADGKPKVFRDSIVTNLVEFFDRFRRLNVRSNDGLDALVSQARQIVQGLEPQSLRENRILRDTVASELGDLRQSLDQFLVERPRRNILRRPQPAEVSP
ncbi:MAG: hypothetical protein C0483_10450 [Pirellula sp.]|nr:hypothetical protein [Pirellula sp.]